jgi:hypothetical protein
VHAREDFRILDVKEVQLVIFFTSVTGDIYIYIESISVKRNQNLSLNLNIIQSVTL